MNLVSCEHPVRLFDKIKGTHYYVPCGKCDICRNRISQDWVHRLQKESECWQYSYFFTLTYDNAHLPTCHLEYIDGVPRLVDITTGKIFDYVPSLKELPFIRKMKKLSYVNVRDVQLFIKRLRYYKEDYEKKQGFRNCDKTYSGLRYYICFEYGETTHRIHCHGLLFFNDRKGDFVSEISDLIYKCWQNGNTNCSSVQSGSAAKYVAKYSSFNYKYKGLYSSPEFCVRHIQSKNPPIGSLLFNTPFLQKLFFSSAIQYRSYLADKYIDLPLPLHIKNRLYPKCPEFDRLSLNELVTIYSLPKQYESVEKLLTVITDYVSFPQRHVITYLRRQYNVLNKYPCNSIIRIWRIAKRVLTQCDTFNISLTNYLQHVRKYYNRVALFNLKSQYELQEELQNQMPSCPVAVWLSLDYDFISYIENNTLDDIPEWMLSTIEGYGVDPIRYCTDKKFRESLHFSRYPVVQSYLYKVHKMYAETKKIKAKKDYERQYGYFDVNNLYNQLYLNSNSYAEYF